MSKRKNKGKNKSGSAKDSCPNCGGPLRKDKSCKRCGYTKQTTRRQGGGYRQVGKNKYGDQQGGLHRNR